MSRIVTGPDGTRYRLTDEVGEARYSNPDGKHVDLGDGRWGIAEGGPESRAVRVVEPLPCISNWPLPGPAPQYLSDNLTTEIRRGDWLIIKDTLSWQIFERCTDEKENLGGLLDARGHKQLMLEIDPDVESEYGVWLISRADPEADA